MRDGLLTGERATGFERAAECLKSVLHRLLQPQGPAPGPRPAR
jgi:hypothetical protein